MRCAATRSGVPVGILKKQEQASTDLKLSELRRWQDALLVPITELIVDDGAMSKSVLERAKLVRIMKTVLSIRVLSHNAARVGRLAEMLTEQLIEIMPELDGIAAWHLTGESRHMEDLGRIAERSFPDEEVSSEEE